MVLQILKMREHNYFPRRDIKNLNEASPFFKIFLISCIFSLFLTNALAADVPDHKGYVNDYGEMISPKTRGLIETKLKNFEKSDSSEIVILTVPSLKGELIDNFSIKVAQAWEIGQKKDGGILITVAKKDRKIRIEVSKGLEGRVTNFLAKRIIDSEMTPRFKRGDFDGGFIAGISALINTIKGVIPPPRKKKPDII